ncbi:MAG: radical SAM protein [Methanolobus sp.]|nr:radical SAM protein [Methanolobus sp.]
MVKPLFLDNYLKIANDELPSGSKLLKRIPVAYDDNESENELWNKHDLYMRTYRDQKQNIYFSGMRTDERQADKSLFDLKTDIAGKMIDNCHFCQHRCGVNRRNGEKGFCKLTDTSRYAAEFLHMGEEPELVPSHTIFFTGCVLCCIYCQNWDISMHPEAGREVNATELARRIDKRRREGANNLNLVTPTPHLHNILRTLSETSVSTPVVWNSNMYHSPEAARLLEGVVDVFLADFKYGNNECALRYSKVEDYMQTVISNMKYAYQDAELLVRHLVLPGHLDCCSVKIIEWIAANTPDIRFNLMFQYRPGYLAFMYPEINRNLLPGEKEEAIRMVKDAGLKDILL